MAFRRSAVDHQFPNEKDWRQPSKLEWITEGLGRSTTSHSGTQTFILSRYLRLGHGQRRTRLERSAPERFNEFLAISKNVDILVYEPTEKYQNVAKRNGVEELTPARVLIAEMIRRYWVLGIECTYLEVQKLGWFLERAIHSLGIEDPLEASLRGRQIRPLLRIGSVTCSTLSTELISTVTSA